MGWTGPGGWPGIPDAVGGDAPPESGSDGGGMPAFGGIPCGGAPGGGMFGICGIPPPCASVGAGGYCVCGCGFWMFISALVMLLRWALAFGSR